MEKINDGVPAFPCKVIESVKRQSEAAGIYVGDHMGMTIRDKFAGDALIGICSHNDTWGLGSAESIANKAYSLADAMLKAREVKS